MEEGTIISLRTGSSSRLAKFLRHSKCGNYLIVQVKANKDKAWHDPMRILPSEVRCIVEKPKQRRVA